jgi:hypothetical protein
LSIKDFWRVRKWQLVLRPTVPLLLCADAELLGAADRAEHSRILLILELTFASPAAFPGTDNNKLDSKLAEHLRQPRSGRAIAVVLDAL